MPYQMPSPEQLEALRAADDGAPVSMLNLLAYRDQAAYPDHPDEQPCSGREAFGRYAAATTPIIEALGGGLVFAGAASPLAIGPESERWDDVVIVQYPSRASFLEMLESESYQAVVHHRRAALADSRLVPIAAGSPAFQS